MTGMMRIKLMLSVLTITALLYLIAGIPSINAAKQFGLKDPIFNSEFGVPRSDKTKTRRMTNDPGGFPVQPGYTDPYSPVPNYYTTPRLR